MPLGMDLNLDQFMHQRVPGKALAIELIGLGHEWSLESYCYIPEIDRIIFNDPATIVFWKDGTKTVVKAANESFSEEKGLAMAIAKRYFGNMSRFKKALQNATRQEKKEAKK